MRYMGVTGVQTCALPICHDRVWIDRACWSLSLNRGNAFNQILSEARPTRPVYPYSVVAGGIEDAKELKWVAEHDPIVGAHYAGFNYAHAQVVRLTLARTVYLSYRIGNNIYWTHRRVTLHKGVKLITH